MPGKTDAISRRDRARLTHIVHSAGFFTGIRGGRKIAIQWQHNASVFGRNVMWTLFVERRRITGFEDTVYNACETLNAEIRNSYDRRRRLAS